MGGAIGRGGVDHRSFLVSAMIEPITKLDAFKDAVTDDALFACALADTVAALTRPLIGLSLAESVVRLEKLRQHLEDIERAHHDRPRAISEFASAEIERDAEREAVLKKAELLAWAYERQAAREAAEHERSKPRAEPAPARRSHRGADMTEQWRGYIRAQLDAQQRAMMKAVAQVVVDEERAREALQRRIEQLEREISELKGRDIDRRLRAVPSAPPESMIA